MQACCASRISIPTIQGLLQNITIADCGWLCELTEYERKMKAPEHVPRLINCASPKSVQEALGSMKGLGCVNYLHTATVDVSVFIIPSNFRLPLHDHPSLTIAQKFLFGRARVVSFDWLSHGRATVVFSGEKCPSDSVDIILPKGGGVLHEIWNDNPEPVMFIDVITPPYHEAPHFSDCTYFTARSVDLSTLHPGTVVSLEPCAVQPSVTMTTFVPLR